MDYYNKNLFSLLIYIHSHFYSLVKNTSNSINFYSTAQSYSSSRKHSKYQISIIRLSIWQTINGTNFKSMLKSITSKLYLTFLSSILNSNN